MMDQCLINIPLISLGLPPCASDGLTLKALKFCCINHGIFFYYEIIINVLVNFFRFI